MKKFIDRFWFIEAPAERLAWMRLLIGGFALWHVGSRYSSYLTMGSTKASLFDPVGAVAFLDTPLPVGLWNALLIACLATNVLFVLGAFHRFSGPAFAALILTVLCYRNSWGMIYHTDNLIVLHVIVLGVTRSADALSLDAFRRRKGGGTESSWEYGWPVQLMCAVTVAAYLLAGVAKVAGPLGWAWVEGEAFRSQIAMDAIRKELLGKPAPALAFELYDKVALFTFLGVVTYVLELGAPLALVHRRIGWAWVVLVWGMHWGILFLMDIKFPYQLWGIGLISFLPMERLTPLVPRLGRKKAIA